MAKTRTDSEDAQLAAAGFDPSATAAQALGKLREIATPENEVAIARALGNIPDAGAAAMLAEMEAPARGGLRREIRRSIFKLHQRGIATPETPRSEPPATTPAAAADETLTAYFSPIDSEGTRVIWLMKQRTRGGVARLWGLVSESEGLAGAIVSGFSRKELRAEREELERRASMRFVEGDWHLADFILCEAFRRTPEERRARVGNFLALRSELTSAAVPIEIDHPLYRELGPDIPDEPASDLLKEAEVAEWKFSAAEIAPYAEELGRANESTIVLNEIQQRERVETIVGRALSELFSGESGDRFRRRFEDTGYYMLHSGRRDGARWAAAAANQISAGADLKRVAFFQAFVRAQLGAVMAEEQQRASEQPRLIMTPAEAMRAREASARRRR